ncbi:MAG: hypothetical protein HWN65_19545 [Candidatus Helarchaeota archaeon]|nr:hypothetical protein [Candidatus Helarchaeota archaeon]
MRINLPDELDKEFRTIIASKYGYSKGALSLATQDAILKWILKNGKEPWLYIDSNMSLDIHEELILPFFKKVAELLDPQKISISFEASREELDLISKIFENFELDGDDVFFEVEKSDFIPTLRQFIRVLKVTNKPSLLIELDDLTIIGGGAGCLNICGEISTQKYNEIVLNFLKDLNVEVKSNLNDKKNYQLILLNSNSTLIELYDTG